MLWLLCSWPADAAGYCRTRTCDVDGSCDKDERGCSIGGKPARWSNPCLSFALQQDGSRLQGISAQAAAQVAEDAFRLWTDSECHIGGSPPLTFTVAGEVSCSVPEYNCNPADWNANVIMFQDEGWVHSPAALAITCVTMNLDTGEILDADMEINTTPPFFEFSLPGEGAGADLHTVLTHEAGHFIGLNHSELFGAVMFEHYEDSVLLSSLSDDDIAGACEIYGASKEDPRCEPALLPDDTACVGTSACVPVRRQSNGCACRFGAPAWASNPQHSWPAFALLCGAGWVFRRRRFTPGRD